MSLDYQPDLTVGPLGISGIDYLRHTIIPWAEVSSIVRNRYRATIVTGAKRKRMMFCLFAGTHEKIIFSQLLFAIEEHEFIAALRAYVAPETWASIFHDQHRFPLTPTRLAGRPQESSDDANRSATQGEAAQECAEFEPTIVLSHGEIELLERVRELPGGYVTTRPPFREYFTLRHLRDHGYLDSDQEIDLYVFPTRWKITSAGRAAIRHALRSVA